MAVWTEWVFDELAPDERLEALRRLRRFVDWLNEAYELPLSTWAVPGCWYQHAGVVRELWALLASYQHAYTARSAQEAALPSENPLYWHDRSLWPCLRRLRQEHGLQECTASNEHVARTQNLIKTDDGFGAAVERLAVRGWKE